LIIQMMREWELILETSFRMDFSFNNNNNNNKFFIN
jgi:hypothetical protein